MYVMSRIVRGSLTSMYIEQYNRLATCEREGFHKWRNLFFAHTADEWHERISQEEIISRRMQWQSYINTEAPIWEKVQQRFHGRGIVVTAGNADTYSRTLVLIHLLQEYGSKLPIEVHYSGGELSQEHINQLEGLGVFVHNLSSKEDNVVSADLDPHVDRSYYLKIAALINARCVECLSLDSDNLPTRDPEYLFDTREYKQTGTLFWPDFWKTEAENPIWQVIDTQCKDEMELESGQIVVNKAKAWRALMLANYLGEQHNFYNEFLMGDKDLFRFAYHAVKQPFHLIRTWISIVGHKLPTGQMCGHSMLQHDPAGQPAFMHANLVKLYSDDLMRSVAVASRYPDWHAFFKYSQYAPQSDPNYKFGLSFESGLGYVAFFTLLV